MDKRGISPVVATVLLIVIALILGVIIFLWARSFVMEKAVKFGEPIENACGSISFEAEADSISSEISIINRGSVPIYEFEIYKLDSGSRTFVVKAGCRAKTGIGAGENCNVLVTEGLTSGRQISIVPVILGTKGNENEEYTCLDSGEEITAS